MNKLSTPMESIIFNHGGSPDDWRETVSIVNSSPDEAKNFIGEIKNIVKNVHPNQQVLALDLLDYVVVECGLTLHTQVSSKDFITFMLTLLKTKDSASVQIKILTLIKKWGIRFENKRDILPNFYETFNSLKKNNVIFPDDLESTYFQYLKAKEVIKKPVVKEENLFPDFSNLKISENENKGNIAKKEENNNNYGDVRLDLNPENYPKKYKKFVSELLTLLNYIALSNEMIDSSDYKKSIDEGIKEMVETVRDLFKNLQMAIENQIQHETLLAICLGINDDIINLFKRYDDLKAKKKPETFVSVFHTEYKAYNLNNAENNSIKNKIPDNENFGVFANSNNNQNKKPDNSNLIEFDFVKDNSNKNSSSNQNENQNIPPKINDINDLFDAFK